MINVLHISPYFNYSCGVSKNVYTILNYLSQDTDYNVHFITNGGDATNEIRNLNVNFEIMNFGLGAQNLLFLVNNIRTLNKYCIENHIQIIHTHHRYPEFLTNQLSKKISLKSVTTAHSFVKGFKKISYKSNKIIGVSKSVVDHLKKQYQITDSKIVTLYNCLNLLNEQQLEDMNDLKDRFDVKGHNFVILYLGRLNKIKGIDTLIRAFRKLGKAYLQVKLILVGDVLDNSLKKMKLRSDEDIIYLAARKDVKSLYQLCDVVVLPSNIEALGYSMLEAGYFKKPFIGSRTGGIAEFIDDGVNGSLFEPGNAEDLANKIKFVINNPEKAKSAAEELYKKVKKYCNCEEYFAKLTNIYNELLNE